MGLYLKIFKEALNKNEVIGVGPNLVWCYCSVAQLCLTLCDPMDCSTPGFPVHHYLPEFAQLMSIESVMSSNHLILCHPLVFLPSIFPGIRVFGSESACCIRWAKYWNFCFSINPSNEYSGLISFRIDWFDLLAIQAVWQYTTFMYLFPYLEPVRCSMSSSNCCFLTCIQISQEADQDRKSVV